MPRTETPRRLNALEFVGEPRQSGQLVRRENIPKPERTDRVDPRNGNEMTLTQNIRPRVEGWNDDGAESTTLHDAPSGKKAIPNPIASVIVAEIIVTIPSAAAKKYRLALLLSPLAEAAIAGSITLVTIVATPATPLTMIEIKPNRNRKTPSKVPPTNSG